MGVRRSTALSPEKREAHSRLVPKSLRDVFHQLLLDFSPRGPGGHAKTLNDALDVQIDDNTFRETARFANDDIGWKRPLERIFFSLPEN
ncbi:MAG: hypothetical protein ABSF91_12290 [Bacteroidota bacterium]|jgi:hypothetical protein